ncbi:MAG TPA: MFS transporter [Puia sp.]|nr:MFS transporter [Puia sp.]
MSRRSFEALTYRDFRRYIGMRCFFTLAGQMQVTILGFYVYQFTHSKMAIALVGLFGAIPAIGGALYGGHIADRAEKRKLLLISCGGAGLLSLALLAVMGGGLSGRWILPVIYAVICCNGIVRVFYEPAAHIVYAQSIPKALYPKASSWDNASWQVASIAGPAIAGFLYGFAGIAVALGAVALCMMTAWGFVFRLRKYPAVYAGKEPLGKSVAAGLRFIFGNKVMVYAMSLDLFCVLFGGVIALLPVYALDILHVGTEGLGIMRMAFSLGATLTMLAMVHYSPMGKPWRNLLLAVTGFGISIIAFGLSHNFLLSLALLFLQGAFDSVSVLIRSTLMQMLTPDEMRGRVSAVNSLFISSSSELGDLESGVAAGLLGTAPAVVFGGAMTLLITGFVSMRPLPSTMPAPDER